MIGDIEQRFRGNLERVERIISLYDDWTGASRGRPSVSEGDVLRGAVVLLHATLEDLMRDLAFERMPFADKEILARLPFPGGDGRKTNFTIADLVGHRDRLVGELIAESVKLYLDHRSYNNINDIAGALREIGLNTSQTKCLIDALGSSLDALIRRRHLIAHRLDRNDAGGRGQHFAMSIGKATVMKWIESVQSFGRDLLFILSNEIDVESGTST